jgi:VCBS repeat-containing protein
MPSFGFSGWRTSDRRKVHPLRSRRPRHEWLEDRRLLSTTNPNAIATVGVYDENVINTNKVDFEADGSTVSSAKFKDYIASQYQYDNAGVIDGSALGGYYSYGTDQSKILTVQTDDGTNWAIGSAYGISGTGAFASSVEGGYGFTSFRLFPESGERVVAVGVTVLSVSNNHGVRDYGNVTVTAHLSSGGTLSASRHIDEAKGAGDTFYGFEAPEGDAIAGFSLKYDGPVYGTPDVSLWFDDIGFVTGKAITSTDHAPVATYDSYTMDADSTLMVAAPGVLSNDADDDGDPISAALVPGSGPSHGQLDFHSDGSFTYTPAAGFIGTDTFSYVANDGNLSSNTATGSITVNPVNQAPVAKDDSYSVNEDTTLTVEAPGYLGNDTDADGDGLSADLVSQPSHGQLVFNRDGSFTYVPKENFSGTDQFSYFATDGSLASKTATVTITVKAVNDAPTVTGGTFSIPENSADGTVVGAVKGSDIDGDSLTYSLVGGNENGAFKVDPDSGEVSVADGSKLDYETTPRFVLTVQATDPGGLSARTTVTVLLTDVSETVPVAIDVLPGDPDNSINIRSHGKIEVAILSSSVFNALDVDVNSLTFGASGFEDSLSRTPHGLPRYRLADVNGDGRLDLVVAFETEKTGFEAGDVLGVLQGRTRDGGTFEASAPIFTKAPNRGR